MGKYWKFSAMIATSVIAMLGLMYLNTYQVNHLYFSETRAYMALVMGATMALIMNDGQIRASSARIWIIFQRNIKDYQWPHGCR